MQKPSTVVLPESVTGIDRPLPNAASVRADTPVDCGGSVSQSLFHGHRLTVDQLLRAKN